MGQRLAPVPPLARAAAVIRSAALLSISAMSSVPAASATARLPRGTALRTIESSLARFPHQRGLRTSVAFLALRSTDLRLNGPALVFSEDLAPSLKAVGEPMTSFG